MISERLGSQLDEQYTFILPPLRRGGEYPCSKEWCEARKHFNCGCPLCLELLGLTLLYHPDDVSSMRAPNFRRKLVASIKLAAHVPERIVEGYEQRYSS